MLTVRGDGGLSVSGDYFGRGRDGYAVLDADLTLQSLQELSDPDMYPGLGNTAANVPATYLLTASRHTPSQ